MGMVEGLEVTIQRLGLAIQAVKIGRRRVERAATNLMLLAVATAWVRWIKLVVRRVQ